MKKLLLASHSLLFLFFFMSLANIQYNQDVFIFLAAVVVSAYIVTTPPNIFKTWDSRVFTMHIPVNTINLSPY